MSLLPAAFLFRYTLPVQRVDQLPRTKNPLLSLPASCEMPALATISGEQPFAKLSLAWNPQGLAVQVKVAEKTGVPQCNPDSPMTSERIQIWIDTRDTQNVHRASRFCHHFVLLPCENIRSNTKQLPDSPASIHQLPIPRAKEEAPEADLESVLLENEIAKDQYTVSCWFPREALHGFDPESQSRIGFYLHVVDNTLGKQSLTVDPNFPFDSDPSMWVTLDLVST